MILIDKINKKQINPNVPNFQVGDTVRVDVKIIEGKRERIQAFEGIVTSRKGGSVSETFTVRKKSGSVGINRVFPVNSPLIEKITVIKKGSVRRAKLYYLRGLTGKAATKIKEKKKKSQMLESIISEKELASTTNGSSHSETLKEETVS